MKNSQILVRVNVHFIPTQTNGPVHLNVEIACKRKEKLRAEAGYEKSIDSMEVTAFL